MAEGKNQQTWAQTAWIACTIVNANRDPKKPAIKPVDCNPYLAERRQAERRRQASDKQQSREAGRIFLGVMNRGRTS